MNRIQKLLYYAFVLLGVVGYVSVAALIYMFGSAYFVNQKHRPTVIIRKNYVVEATPIPVDLKVELQTNVLGIQIIKDEEDYREFAYLDHDGEWAIGWGSKYWKHPNKPIRYGDRITVIQAEQLLRRDIKLAEVSINKYVQVPLSLNQFSSLVSFVYNVGEGKFSKSELLKKLNNKEYQAAALEFDRWVYSKRSKMAGLIRRRGKEKELFLMG